jgi:hypothetical protein
MIFTDLISLESQHTRDRGVVDPTSQMLREPRLLMPGMQPLGPVKLDPLNSLSKNLVFYDFLGKPKNSDVVVGTKTNYTRYGIMRGFGSTYGISSTDSVKTSLNYSSPYRTYSISFIKTGAGGGTLGRLFDKRTTSGETELLLISNSSGNFQYTRVWSGGSYAFLAGPISNNIYYILVLTYLSEYSGFQPNFYLNGTQLSVTGGPSNGSVINYTDNFVIGNRLNDSARNFDGLISDFFVWDRILTPAEISSFFIDKYQMFIPA